MLFKKKAKKEGIKCDNCRSKISDDYSFCPYCGNVLFDPEMRARDFGMLGKSDMFDDSMAKQKIADSNLTITDKMISSIVNSLMKNLDKQFREIDKSESTRNGKMPGRINIKIGLPENSQVQENKRMPRHDFSSKKISSEQLDKMSSLPKIVAKTNIKRLGDKVIYELEAPGIESIKDIFVSKIESGYEIKAIGKNKVYVNSLPVNLPIKGFSITDKGINVEFSLQ